MPTSQSSQSLGGEIRRPVRRSVSADHQPPCAPAGGRPAGGASRRGAGGPGRRTPAEGSSPQRRSPLAPARVPRSGPAAGSQSAAVATRKPARPRRSGARRRDPDGVDGEEPGERRGTRPGRGGRGWRRRAPRGAVASSDGGHRHADLVGDVEGVAAAVVDRLVGGRAVAAAVDTRWPARRRRRSCRCGPATGPSRAGVNRSGWRASTSASARP